MAAAPATPAVVLWLGTQVVNAVATAACGSPWWNRPTGATRIAPPLLAPWVMIVPERPTSQGSAPAASCSIAARVVGPAKCG